MKRILSLSMMILALTLPAMAQHQGHGTAKTSPVTLTGEVLDMNCYMMHPESGTGPDHAKCAQSCISKGMSVGFLASDGTVYLLLGTGHESANAKVKDFAGKKSTITGTLYNQKGIKAIELATITAAK